MSDAVGALDELADLTQLEAALRQDYPGARMDDIDEAAIRRALGRSAVDDLEALKQVERELEQQGYLLRRRGKLELTPRPYGAWGRPRCAASSPPWRAGAAATTTRWTRARPVSSPAPHGPGGSATSSRSTWSVR